MENVSASEEDFDFDPETKAGVEKNVTEDGGVVKKILVEGSGWKTPEKGDSVAVHYVGTLLDGTQFDSSRDRGEPFNFSLGQGQVIKGWDEGVKTMKKGEKSILTCKPEYAYGSSGSPPTIPPDATLNFEIELLHWKNVSDLTGDEGVIKKTMKEGEGYDNPKDRDEVLVKYTARLKEMGTVIASTPDEGVEFVLEDGHFCMGLGIAVREMKKGEEAIVTLSPKYAKCINSPHEPSAEAESVELELTLVSWKKVEEISSDGLIIKKTLKSIDKWRKPREGSVVKIRYTARLTDGTVFDERLEGNELEFMIDEEQVIEGLDKAIMKMNEGETAEITIGSKYAFVEETQAEKAVIPAGADVIYEVELIDVKDPKNTYEMSSEEKLESCQELKEKGNKAYKEGKYIRAISKYEQALKPIEYDTNFDEDTKKQAKEMKKVIWLNIAAVSLKQGEYSKALSNCNKVLEAEPNNIKALYRRSQAFMYRSDFIEAERDIKLAHSLDSANRDVVAQYKKLKQYMKSSNQKDAEMYSNMFKKLAVMKDPESVPVTKEVERDLDEPGPSGS
eukprot:g1187.t1